jgi:hypothetical protein
MSAARYEFWNERAARDEFDPARLVKFLIVAPDACQDCLNIAYNGKGERISVLGLATAFNTCNGGFVHPPLHPQCRCSVIYQPERDLSELDDTIDIATGLPDPLGEASVPDMTVWSQLDALLPRPENI